MSIFLDTTLKKLQAFIEGAPTTTNPVYFVSYGDTETLTFGATTVASNDGALNGATAVDIVSAPASGAMRSIRGLSIQNKDTVTHTVTVRILDNATQINLGVFSVPSTFSLFYSPETGWQVGATTGPGTVTSVGLSLPAEFTVSGSPVTSSGTLTATWANESANLVFAGPTGGGAATPGFRALVGADIPSLSGTYLPLTGGTMSGAIALANGSAAAPELAFNTNYGFFYDTTNVGVGISVNGVQRGVFTSTQSLFQATGAGYILEVDGESGTGVNIGRYTTDTGAAVLQIRKGRGTIAAPAVPALNDQIGNISYQGYNGAGNTTGVQLRGTLIETGSIDSTHMGMKFTISTVPIGSGTLAEVFRVDNTQLSAFNGNIFLDPNLVLRSLSTTVGSNPATATSGAMLVDTDEGGGPAFMFNDGTSYRRVNDGQVASSTVGARGILARFTARCSWTYQNIVHTTYQKLSDAGLLTKLTGLWVHAVPTNQTDGLINWITPGTRTMTITGSPTWTANQGFTGDGATALLSTTATPATFGASQDNISIGCYVRTGSASSAAVIGQTGGIRRNYLSSATSSTLTSRLSDTTDDTFTPARYTGLFTLTRGAGANYQWFLDDSASTTITRASTAISGNTNCFLGTTDTTSSQFSTAQICFSFIGTNLSTSDVAHLRGILVDYYLVQIGAVTAAIANLPAAGDFQGQTYYIPDLGGGAGLLQSDGTNWFRSGGYGYESRSLATGSETITYLTNAENVLYNQTLTGNCTVTLSGTDAKGTIPKKGSKFLITHNNVTPGAFTFAIANGGGGGGTLITFGSATNKAAICVFDGTNWQLMMDSAI